MDKKKANVPKIRFFGFKEVWKEHKVGNYLFESRILGSNGEMAKKLTVKLWGKGVIKKEEKYKGSKNTNYFVRKAGQFIYGKLDFLNQAFGIIPKELDGYESTLDSPSFDISSKINSYFFLKYVLRKEFYFYQGTIASGSRKAKRIHAETFCNMPIFIPKIEEQERIGTFFCNIDKLITLYQRKLNHLQVKKKGLLQKMFPKDGEDVPELRFPGFTDAWEQHRLGDLGSVAMNRRIFKEETSENGEVPFYKIGTFGNKPDAFISRKLFEEYKSKYPYPEIGDILISASGSIGRTVQYMGEDEYFQDSNIVWLKHDERLVNSFLKQFYFVVMWNGLEGSTIKRLYNKNILETLISLPNAEEQKKVGQFFSRLDNLITLHQRKLTHLQEQKKALLQQMFV